MAERVLVMDSRRIDREALCELLTSLGFVVAAAGAFATDVVPHCRGGRRPGLLVSRVTSNAEADGAATAIREIRSSLPGLKAVILADEAVSEARGLAMQPGVDAVLSRHISSDVLKRSLELVLLGQRILSAHVPPARPARPGDVGLASVPHSADLRGVNGSLASLLSRREQEILRCLMTGMSNKSIARMLDIAEATVKVHVKGMLRKTRLGNRTQIAVWAMQNGHWVEPRIIEAPPALDLAEHGSCDVDGR